MGMINYWEGKLLKF